MKVRTVVTVDVNPEAWELAFGVPPERMREDVRAYVEGAVYSALDHEDLLTTREGDI